MCQFSGACIKCYVVIILRVFASNDMSWYGVRIEWYVNTGLNDDDSHTRDVPVHFQYKTVYMCIRIRHITIKQ